ncbi:MAG: glycosyltransferase [Verrucomicrobia bacterium]|nr:glycosyltransferase [Verrucomicrobiota bacterium]
MSEIERENVPTVSVIMPAFNAQPTLQASAESVLAQSFRSLELIIVDDASLDETRDVANQLLENDDRVVFRRHVENQGAAVARNSALALAKGRYIAFLDADDLWLPEKVTRQIAFMEETDAAFSFTGFWRENAKSATPGRREVKIPARVDYKTLLRGNVIGCLTAMYDRSKLGDCPMPNLRMRQDFALWLEITSRTGLAFGLTEPLAVHRERPGSLASDKIKASVATWRLYHEHLGLGRFRSSYFLINHLLRRVRRG